MVGQEDVSPPVERVSELASEWVDRWVVEARISSKSRLMLDAVLSSRHLICPKESDASESSELDFSRSFPHGPKVTIFGCECELFFSRNLSISLLCSSQSAIAMRKNSTLTYRQRGPCRNFRITLMGSLRQDIGSVGRPEPSRDSQDLICNCGVAFALTTSPLNPPFHSIVAIEFGISV